MIRNSDPRLDWWTVDRPIPTMTRGRDFEEKPAQAGQGTELFGGRGEELQGQYGEGEHHAPARLEQE
jgi:hypothetical protein